MADETIRVTAIMEAEFVTGPAKNLLEFARRARAAPEGMPAIELSVVTYHRGLSRPPEANPFIAAAARTGVPVDVIYESRAFDPRILPQIHKVIRSRQPHIVQTHNVKSHFLLRYSGLWHSYHWIAFHHGYTTTDFKMRAYNQLDRWSLRAAARVVTVCGPFRNQLVQRGVSEQRITVQHNAISAFVPPEESQVAAVRQELSVAQNVPILLMVGRLSHEKGHVDAVKAFAMLKARRMTFRVVIVGDGPERTAIELACRSCGVNDCVTLVGLKNDVRPYLASASLFIMPSHSEGSPNALLEAMAAGLPIVASRAGGIPELVDDDNTALLISPRRPAELADAIQTLLENPGYARRLGDNALDASARFTYEEHHAHLVDIYRGVLNP